MHARGRAPRFERRDYLKGSRSDMRRENLYSTRNPEPYRRSSYQQLMNMHAHDSTCNSFSPMPTLQRSNFPHPARRQGPFLLLIYACHSIGPVNIPSSPAP